jgi:hypothetical protein
MRAVICFALLTSAFLGVAANPVDARTWTDRTTGRRLDAEFVGFADGKVQIKRARDGKTFHVPLESLSDDDQVFVRSQTEPKQAASLLKATPSQEEKSRIKAEQLAGEKKKEEDRIKTDKPTEPYYTVEKTDEGTFVVIHHNDDKTDRLKVGTSGDGGITAFDKNGKNCGFAIWINGEITSVNYGNKEVPKKPPEKISAKATPSQLLARFTTSELTSEFLPKDGKMIVAPDQQKQLEDWERNVAKGTTSGPIVVMGSGYDEIRLTMLETNLGNPDSLTKETVKEIVQFGGEGVTPAPLQTSWYGPVGFSFSEDSLVAIFYKPEESDTDNKAFPAPAGTYKYHIKTDIVAVATDEKGDLIPAYFTIKKEMEERLIPYASRFDVTKHRDLTEYGKYVGEQLKLAKGKTIGFEIQAESGKELFIGTLELGKSGEYEMVPRGAADEPAKASVKDEKNKANNPKPAKTTQDRGSDSSPPSPEKNKAAESPDFSKTPGGWPALSGELNGLYEVRVKNPNDFKVRVGLRSEGKGKDFVVPANQSQSVKVPSGKYDVYFHYSTDPDGLYQGDAFTLKTNGVEIQIVEVVGGNYGIRKVK